MTSSRRVDAVIVDFHKTMKRLKGSLRGIPFRSGSFYKQHDNLAIAVALLTVELDSARSAVK